LLIAIPLYDGKTANDSSLPVDAIRITILTDNVTDPLLFPSEQV